MTTTSVPPIVSDSVLGELPDRIVVSPGHGRVYLSIPESFTTEGEFVRSGAVVARLASDGRDVSVCAPCDAWVVDYLVREGQRVQPGVPIVHLRSI